MRLIYNFHFFFSIAVAFKRINVYMFLGQEFKIFDWFIIHFTENNGMAFGLEFGGETGKVLLSIFRFIVVIWGIYYVNELTKKSLPNGVLVSLGLVIGGAIGNPGRT